VRCSAAAGGETETTAVLTDITRLKTQQAELEALARDRELMFSLSDIGIGYLRGGRVERADEALAGSPATAASSSSDSNMRCCSKAAPSTWGPPGGRGVLDSVLVGVVTVGDGGIVWIGIVWVNRSARRMFGGELGDFIGRPIAAVATDE
jgi:hypothetical protein